MSFPVDYTEFNYTRYTRGRLYLRINRELLLSRRWVIQCGATPERTIGSAHAGGKFSSWRCSIGEHHLQRAKEAHPRIALTECRDQLTSLFASSPGKKIHAAESGKIGKEKNVQMRLNDNYEPFREINWRVSYKNYIETIHKWLK